MKYAQTVYQDKKPSITQIMAEIKRHITQGAEHITITWGENEIRIENQRQWIGPNGPWTGDGWIRKHGGSNIAATLNEQLRKKFDV